MGAGAAASFPSCRAGYGVSSSRWAPLPTPASDFWALLFWGESWPHIGFGILSPAVTIGFLALGKFPSRASPGYEVRCKASAPLWSDSVH